MQTKQASNVIHYRGALTSEGRPPRPHHQRAAFNPLYSTTMPTHSIQQEDRIELALKTLNDGVVEHTKAVARLYDVSETTLRCRKTGTLPRAAMASNCLRLTPEEESVLKR